MPQREQTLLRPLSPEQRRREARYRAAFARLSADLRRRPEPRGYFDRPACGRTRPWEHIMFPVRIAIAAGQTRENALEIVREMVREIDDLLPPPADISDPAAILVTEALREAQLRAPKVRALVSRHPADYEAAADAIEQEAREDMLAAQELRRHARRRSLVGAGARGAARSTATGALLEVAR